MRDIKVLHIADIHIGRKYRALSSQKAALRASEVLLTLENTIRRFVDADVVLISGDLFEPDAPNESVDFVSRLFASNPNVRFFVSCGNHDCRESSVIQWFEKNASDNVFIFSDSIEKIVIEELKTVIYGVSFAAPCSYTSLLNGFEASADEYAQIMVMHGDADTSSIYNPISNEEIAFSGLDYLALGHIHSFSGFVTVGDVTYAYPGILEPGGFDETGECGVIYGTVGKTEINLDFYPVSKRKYCEITLDISGFSSQLQVITELKNKMEPDYLYKIILTGSPDFGVPDIELYLSTLDAFYVEFINECRPSKSILDYDGQNTLIGKTASILASKRDTVTEDVFEKACNILTNLMC